MMNDSRGPRQPVPRARALSGRARTCRSSPATGAHASICAGSPRRILVSRNTRRSRSSRATVPRRALSPSMTAGPATPSHERQRIDRAFPAPVDPEVQVRRRRPRVAGVADVADDVTARATARRPRPPASRGGRSSATARASRSHTQTTLPPRALVPTRETMPSRRRAPGCCAARRCRCRDGRGVSLSRGSRKKLRTAAVERPETGKVERRAWSSAPIGPACRRGAVPAGSGGCTRRPDRPRGAGSSSPREALARCSGSAPSRPRRTGR